MVLIILVLAYLFKIYALGTSLYTDDSNSYLYIAISDSAILALCFILFYFSLFFNKIMSIILKLSIVSLVLFYITDMVLVFMFRSRLYFEDIYRYWNDIDIKLFSPALIYVLVMLFLFCLVFIFKKNAMAKNRKYKIIGFVSILLSACNYNVDSSVRSSFFKNYILVNFDSTYEKEYSDNFISSFYFNNNKKKCINTTKIRPDNIIVFMFESWSNYHSYWFGQDNDWTPEVDKLAKNNISFKQFYANGFTTETGLYALFTGQPFFPYKIKYSTEGKLGLSALHSNISYPQKLSDLGYKTTFITAGDLGFLDKKQWLESLRFDQIIGNDAFNIDDRKFLFSSVSDQKLYEKVYGIVNQKKNNFIVVENVNTHQPYKYPDGNEIKDSEEYAFRYADKQLSDVIKNLSGNNNMIIVMSDHRAMAKMTQKELAESNRMAVSRVPMFMVWNGKNKVINNVFQQTDVLSSIANTIEGYQCSSFSQGAIFPLNNMIDSKCVYHARGDERSKVSAMCDQQQFDVLLDGDDTRALSDNKYSDLSVDYMKFMRIKNNLKNQKEATN